MIEFIKDKSIFDMELEAIVNPVNTVGTMGAGLAEQFKNRFPDYYQEYLIVCKPMFKRLLDVRGGACIPHKVRPYRETPKYIFSFFTKEHWKHHTDISWIHNGMQKLMSWVSELDIKSIGIPALGCGYGGLEWEDVKPIILSYVSGSYECDIKIFEPKKSQLDMYKEKLQELIELQDKYNGAPPQELTEPIEDKLDELWFSLNERSHRELNKYYEATSANSG